MALECRVVKGKRICSMKRGKYVNAKLRAGYFIRVKNLARGVSRAENEKRHLNPLFILKTRRMRGGPAVGTRGVANHLIGKRSIY